jgi:hypothetical protein
MKAILLHCIKILQNMSHFCESSTFLKSLFLQQTVEEERKKQTNKQNETNKVD